MANQPWSALEILGLKAGATEAQIRSAWKVKAKELHPDTGGNAALFDIARQAYTDALAGLNLPPEVDEVPPGERVSASAQEEDFVNLAESARSFNQQYFGKRPKDAPRVVTHPRMTMAQFVQTRLQPAVVGVGLVGFSMVLRFKGVIAMALGIPKGEHILTFFRWNGPPRLSQVGGPVGLILITLVLGLYVTWLWTHTSAHTGKGVLARTVRGIVILSFIFAGEFIFAGVRVPIILIIYFGYVKARRHWMLRERKGASDQNREPMPVFFGSRKH